MVRFRVVYFEILIKYCFYFFSPSQVLRLLYANKGRHLLTLSSNAILKLWKWGPSEKNSRGKVRCMGELNYFKFNTLVLLSCFLKAIITFCQPTTSVPPLLWQPEEGILMKNDTTEANPREAAGCIALCKNEWRIISSSGGKVSLFNANKFKVCFFNITNMRLLS